MMLRRRRSPLHGAGCAMDAHEGGGEGRYAEEGEHMQRTGRAEGRPPEA